MPGMTPPTQAGSAAAPSTTFVAHDAAGYERLMGRWSRHLAPQFLAFTGVADDERVLDVGCGTGNLAQAVAGAARVQSVHGVDLSAAYIEGARAANRHPHVTFSVGDACALDLPGGSFDRVLSLLVLHFVPEPERAIAEMRRVAKPGALVSAAVWDARGGFVATRMFFDTAAALDPRANVRRGRSMTRPMTRPGEMARAWRDAGLQHVEETTLAIRMEFANFDDYWAPYLGKDGPGAEYIATLTEPERERLAEAVKAAYLDGEADGPRSYAALAWAVKGRVPAE
jgi:SAM-dependent methyltransferase